MRKLKENRVRYPAYREAEQTGIADADTDLKYGYSLNRDVHAGMTGDPIAKA